MAGCSTKTIRLVPSDAAAGDLLIAAHVDQKGSLVDVASAVLPEAAMTKTNPDANEIVLLFLLHPGDFVNPDGTPLSAGAFRAVRVRRASEPPADGDHGACLRCLAPTFAPPQIAEAGDSCAPSIFASASAHRVTSDGAVDMPLTDALLGVRDQIRIDWPGACACTAPFAAGGPKRATTPLRVCPLGGDTSMFWPSAFTIANDGTVFSASQGFASVIPPGQAMPSSGLIRIEPAMHEIEGLAALPQGPARFLLSTRRGLDIFGGEGLRLFSGPAGTLTRFDDELKSVTAISVSPLDASGSLYLLGADPPDARSFAAAWHLDMSGTPELETFDVEADDACDTTRAVAIAGAVTLDNGDAVALTKGGTFLFRAAGANLWQCTAKARAPKAPETTDYSFASIGAIGRRVFACLLASQLGLVLTATVPMPLDVSAIKPATLTQFGSGTGVGCIALFRLPESPDRIHAIMTDGQARWIDAFDVAGNQVLKVVDHADPAAIVGTPFDRIATSSSGWVAVTDGIGQIHRRQAGGTFTLASAVTSFGAPSSWGIAPGATGEIWGFAANQRPIRFSLAENAHDCSDVSAATSTQATLSGWDGIVAAARDTTSRRAFLIGGPAMGMNRLARVDLDSGLEEEIDPGPTKSSMLSMIRELAQGTFLVLFNDGTLYSLHHGALAPIVDEWDDPSTPGTEVQPPSFHGWTRIDTSTGVGWAMGDHAIGRVLWNSQGGLRIEGWWLGRLQMSASSVPTVPSAVRSLCPDQVLVGSDERTVLPAGMGGRYFGLWSIGPGAHASDPFAIEVYPTFNHTDDALPTDDERVRAIVSTDGTPAFVFWAQTVGATVYRPGADRTALPFPLTVEAIESGPLTIITSVGPRVAAAFEGAP
jgi:hypothetical protein